MSEKNPFLDDLAEEGWTDMLENGNLRKKPKDEIERFFSTGYTAAIHVCKCLSCGSVTRTLGNILHTETGSKGSTRMIALEPSFMLSIPQEPRNKPVTYLGRTTRICASCVESHGFSLDPTAEARSIA